MRERGQLIASGARRGGVHRPAPDETASVGRWASRALLRSACAVLIAGSALMAPIPVAGQVSHLLAPGPQVRAHSGLSLVQATRDGQARPGAAMILKVETPSPASAAGLMPGDIVTGVLDAKGAFDTLDPNSPDTWLSDLLERQSSQGARFTLSVERAGKRLGVPITLAAPAGAAERTGLTLVPAKGMFVRAEVTAVRPGSPADAAGLQVGDFVLNARLPTRSAPTYVADQVAWDAWISTLQPGPIVVSYARGSQKVHRATLVLPPREIVPPSQAIAAGPTQPTIVSAGAAMGPGSATSVASAASSAPVLTQNTHAPPPAPRSWFCGAFDANYARFFRTGLFQADVEAPTLRSRWVAQLGQAHGLAAPQSVFCTSSKAQDGPAKLKEVTTRLAPGEIQLVASTWTGAPVTTPPRPVPKANGGTTGKPKAK